MEVSLKNALILEPFDRFQKFKRLNWLEFNFLLIGHTYRFKLSTRQRDQRDKITKKTGLLELYHQRKLNWRGCWAVTTKKGVLEIMIEAPRKLKKTEKYDHEK